LVLIVFRLLAFQNSFILAHILFNWWQELTEDEQSVSGWIALANLGMLVHFAMVCIPTYTLAVSISSEINRHAIVQGKSATKMSRQAEQMDQYNAVFARVEQALDVMKAFNPSHVRKIDMVVDKYHRHYLECMILKKELLEHTLMQLTSLDNDGMPTDTIFEMFLDNTATRNQMELLMVAGKQNPVTRNTTSDRSSVGALVTVISGSELLDSTSEWKELLRAPSAKNQEVVEASPLTHPLQGDSR